MPTLGRSLAARAWNWRRKANRRVDPESVNVHVRAMQYDDDPLTPEPTLDELADDLRDIEHHVTLLADRIKRVELLAFIAAASAIATMFRVFGWI